MEYQARITEVGDRLVLSWFTSKGKYCCSVWKRGYSHATYGTMGGTQLSIEAQPAGWVLTREGLMPSPLPLEEVLKLLPKVETGQS